jgi:hypothetical protein
MALLPLGSLISAQALHSQGYLDTLLVHRMHLGWLIYFFLAKYKFSSKDVFKALLAFSVLYSVSELFTNLFCFFSI